MAGNGGPTFESERRIEMANAFLQGGVHYERVRPSYPIESLEWIVPDPSKINDVLDVGAGTGKFTELLSGRDWNVFAVDPSLDMLTELHNKLPHVATHVGTAENVEMPEQSVDVAVAAQAWHWCDPVLASAEMARILRAQGTLGLIWNQLDVSVPWVHRLARIMHAGDVHKPDFRPEVGPQFTTAQVQETMWEQEITPEELIELAKSRSYYLKANDETRARVRSNLNWYLFEHLGYIPGQSIKLPYVTQSWRCQKLPI